MNAITGSMAWLLEDPPCPTSSHQHPVGVVTPSPFCFLLAPYALLGNGIGLRGGRPETAHLIYLHPVLHSNRLSGPLRRDRREPRKGVDSKLEWTACCPEFHQLGRNLSGCAHPSTCTYAALQCTVSLSVLKVSCVASQWQARLFNSHVQIVCAPIRRTRVEGAKKRGCARIPRLDRQYVLVIPLGS
jgi:hypothetical protein